MREGFWLKPSVNMLYRGTRTIVFRASAEVDSDKLGTFDKPVVRRSRSIPEQVLANGSRRMYVTVVGPAAVSGWVTRTASPRGPRFFEAITVSFCEDEEHGDGEPLQALEKPVQVLLEGLVTSENFKDVINGFKDSR